MGCRSFVIRPKKEQCPKLYTHSSAVMLALAWRKRPLLFVAGFWRPSSLSSDVLDESVFAKGRLSRSVRFDGFRRKFERGVLKSIIRFPTMVLRGFIPVSHPLSKLLQTRRKLQPACRIQKKKATTQKEVESKILALKSLKE
jgi:hypothetical protein